VIAVFGQGSTQASQAVQSSLIIRAMSVSGWGWVDDGARCAACHANGLV
jgi:hypothetical protein